MKLLFSIILSIFSISLFSQNIEYTYSRHIYNQVDNSKGQTFDLSGGKVYYEAIPLNKFIFLWSGDYDADSLKNDIGDYDIYVSNKNFSTNYIPDTTSSTFEAPSYYINSDTSDYLWFKLNNTQRAVVDSELIGYDFNRTFIKYNNSSPYNIYKIGILKPGVILTNSELDIIHKYFSLPIFWTDSLNNNGVFKDNRGFEKSVWPTQPVTPSGLTLTLISGGVKIDWIDNSSDSLLTEIWGKSDSNEYELLYTIDKGVHTKNDICVPVDFRYYKIRGKYGSRYTDFTEPDSISMLGPELAINWAGAAFWNVEFPAQWSSDDVKLTCTGAIASRIRRGSFFNIGATYRTITTVTGTGNFRPPYFSTSNQSERVAPGTYTEYVTVTGTTLAIGSSTFAGDIIYLSIKKVLEP